MTIVMIGKILITTFKNWITTADCTIYDDNSNAEIYDHNTHSNGRDNSDNGSF